MKSRPIVTALIGSCLVLTLAASARAQGAVTNVTLSPRTNIAGGTISVTATGTNPCGAARINYGDGDAITYALTALPVTQTHVYPKAGTYTVTVEGMGNCGGAPSTTLTITAPPPPRAAPAAPGTATIDAVEITPMPARVQEPVSVIVRGTGDCAYEVVYGDGTAEQVNARLPEDSHHTYAKAGRYVVVVRPKAPCAGKFTQVLAVDDGVSTPPARITHVLASPSPGTAGEGISIAVHGSGTCAYDVYYGDGSTEAVNATLPRSTQHVYDRPGRYAVVVKPQPPCSGKFTEMLQVADATTRPAPTRVRSNAARVTRVTARPAPAAARQPVRLTIDGFGTCTFRIDYGDGNSESRSMSLPGALRHVYSTPDYYTVVVTPDDPCLGWGRVSIDVRRY